MTRWEKATCPVCRRRVAVSDIRGIAHAHTDKCGRACPMSGREIS